MGHAHWEVVHHLDGLVWFWDPGSLVDVRVVRWEEVVDGWVAEGVYLGMHLHGRHLANACIHHCLTMGWMLNGFEVSLMLNWRLGSWGV